MMPLFGGQSDGERTRSVKDSSCPRSGSEDRDLTAIGRDVLERNSLQPVQFSQQRLTGMMYMRSLLSAESIRHVVSFQHEDGLALETRSVLALSQAGARRDRRGNNLAVLTSPAFMA